MSDTEFTPEKRFNLYETTKGEMLKLGWKGHLSLSKMIREVGDAARRSPAVETAWQSWESESLFHWGRQFS